MSIDSTRENFSLAKTMGELYDSARVLGIEPVDMRSAILSLYFLAFVDVRDSNLCTVKVALPEGCYGREFVGSLVEASDGEVCRMIDEALATIESSNFTAIERGSRPLTNINFVELWESKYGSALVSFVCLVARTFADSVFLDTLTDYRTFDFAVQAFFGDLVEYFARKYPESAQYATPNDILGLMRELVWARRRVKPSLPIRKVFDPACGVGRSLMKCGAGEVYGQEINPVTYTLANMLMLLCGRNAHIALGDSLNDPAFWAHIVKEEFDVAVSTPPLRVVNWSKTDKYDSMYMWGKPSDSYGEWAFVSQMLASVNSDNGMVCTICSAGALFRAGEEQSIRQKVFADNLIDAIVKLPPRSLYNTGMQVFMVIFRKGRKSHEGVLYVDLSSKFKSAKRRNVLSLQEGVDLQETYANFLAGREVACESMVRVVPYEKLAQDLADSNQLFLLQPFKEQEQGKLSFQETMAAYQEEVDALKEVVEKAKIVINEESKWLRSNEP